MDAKNIFTCKKKQKYPYCNVKNKCCLLLRQILDPLATKRFQLTYRKTIIHFYKHLKYKTHKIYPRRQIKNKRVNLSAINFKVFRLTIRLQLT